MSLLRQIQDAAIDSSVDLAVLLRKCKVLAARLGSTEFSNWIDRELNGYANTDELPEYRVLNVTSKGHFNGALQRQLRNADIPLGCIPEKFRKNLDKSFMVQPIAALESLIKSNKGNSIHEPWNPDLVAHVGEGIYQHMACLQAWKVIPPASIVAALDSVRNRVLNFVLEIESQNPEAGEAASSSPPLPRAKVHQIFNTYITGNVQNLAAGSADVHQEAQTLDPLAAELFSKLLVAVSTSEAKPQTASALATTIEGMRATTGTTAFKKHYTSFMSLVADHIQVLGPVVAPYLPGLASILP